MIVTTERAKYAVVEIRRGAYRVTRLEGADLASWPCTSGRYVMHGVQALFASFGIAELHGLRVGANLIFTSVPPYKTVVQDLEEPCCGGGNRIVSIAP